MRIRNVSGHADDDADGRYFEAGGFLEFSEDQLKNEVNKRKIAEGLWLEDDSNPDPPDPPSRADLLKAAADLDITGRTNMRNDELQTAINEAEARQNEEGDG